jgi:hypothetical protein
MGSALHKAAGRNRRWGEGWIVQDRNPWDRRAARRARRLKSSFGD